MPYNFNELLPNVATGGQKTIFRGTKNGGASLFGGHLGDKVRQKSANKQYPKQKSANIRTIFNTWKQAIYGLIFADFMCFFAIELFSHAEVGEDVVEGFLGGNLATGDFGEDVEGLAEVFT